MIEVERRASPAGIAAVSTLIDALDARPGAWLGCDVCADGLYRKASVGCVDPALAFYLDGAQLSALAFDSTGRGLLAALSPLAPFERIAGGLRTRFTGLELLRRFLALFAPAHADLGLYGAWSFDYFRLADAQRLPDDGRRRLVLFFPRRVLVSRGHEAQWIEFAFHGLPEVPADGEFARVAPARLEGEGDELPTGGHAQRVAQAVQLLRSGELVSLVLSQTFRRPLAGSASRAFAALRASNPYPGMFFFNLGGGEKLFGASPDVQVRAAGERVESAPVCGTLRRGRDPLEDVEQALALLGSQKEAAALSGCADSDCNDKAQVCVPGSVELVSHRRVHYFSTIVHTIAHTRGTRRAGADGFDILLAHAAPATVAGVPKPQALAAIERLEPGWRGWYAGAAAYVGCDSSVEAYTILRAARVVGKLAEVRTGGNLLVDSDPASEEDESRLKAQTLFRVLQGDAAVPPHAPARPGSAAARRVRLLDLGDPFKPLLLNALARAGVSIDDDAPTTLVTASLGGEAHWPVELGTYRVVALGTAGIALLVAQGASVQRLERPRFARGAQARIHAQGFLAGVAVAHLGLYATRGIREADLPAGWRCAACDPEGFTLAAAHDDSRACALLFRPDSVLSLGGLAGARVLCAAVDWLAR